MSKSCQLVPGRAYCFQYPRYNYRGLPETQETRRLAVVSIRDLKRDPIEPETARINPTLKRGRWLVTGEDLDKGDERHFYAESMSDVLEMETGEPLAETSYCVVEQRRVAFTARNISEAIAFLLGRRKGVLCSVMKIR